MWTPAILTAALALGQPGVDLPNAVPLPPPPPMRTSPAASYVPVAWTGAAAPEPPPDQTPAPINIVAPLLPLPAPPAAPAAPAAPAVTPPAAGSS